MTENNEHQNTDFALITSFIDNECSPEEKSYVLNEIETNPDFRTYYNFEKNLKANFRKKIRKSIPSDELLEKIKDLIEDETHRRKETISKDKKSNYRIYRLIFPIAAIFLIFISYYIFIFNTSSDFVKQSHDIYDRIIKSEIDLKHKTSDAKELQQIMTKEAGFDVFIPDVKDATLLGGIVNEINGSKVVHFVHKSYDRIIYTMQIKRNDILNTGNFSLDNKHKQEIINGVNWLECDKNINDCTVIWFKNDVFCSSISKLEAVKMATVLTNYK